MKKLTRIPIATRGIIIACSGVGSIFVAATQCREEQYRTKQTKLVLKTEFHAYTTRQCEKMKYRKLREGFMFMR